MSESGSPPTRPHSVSHHLSACSQSPSQQAIPPNRIEPELSVDSCLWLEQSPDRRNEVQSDAIDEVTERGAIAATPHLEDNDLTNSDTDRPDRTSTPRDQGCRADEPKLESGRERLDFDVQQLRRLRQIQVNDVTSKLDSDHLMDL